MFVLKGTHYRDGEISQDFSVLEGDLAVAIGKSWARQGLNPRLLVKTYNGKFEWLNYLLLQKAA